MKNQSEDALAASVRRWRAVTIFLVLSQAVLFLSAFSARSEKTVTAERFVLVDTAGKTRGTLGMMGNIAQLELLNLDGDQGLSVDAGEFATVTLYSGKSKPGVVLGALPDGGMLMIGKAKDAAAGGIFAITGKKEAQFLVNDSGGKPRVVLGWRDRDAHLKLSDANGTERVVLGTGIEENGFDGGVLGPGPGMEIKDANGTQRFTVVCNPVEGGTKTALAIRDAAKQPRIVLGEKAGGVTISALDPQGNVVFQKP